jgi:16S rRNA (cytosine967-C5)-methyltransferase
LFTVSFFAQPSLFLRVRAGKKEKVVGQLDNAGIPFEFNGENCLALPAAAKLDDVLAINRDVVVQDYSSQRVGELLALVRRRPSDQNAIVRPGRSDDWRIWDCCAASGGKSILAADLLGNIKLTVSDIRESVLANLRKRFAEAGISRYESFVANLAENAAVPALETKNGKKIFHLIIADVPCSGSGTWGRTPEQLYYFNTDKIAEYAALQKKIVTNAVQYLDEDGFFLYITCSVFRQENEEVVEFIKEKFHLREVKMELLKGYDKKADTLFAALLQRSV